MHEFLEKPWLAWNGGKHAILGFTLEWTLDNRSSGPYIVLGARAARATDQDAQAASRPAPGRPPSLEPELIAAFDASQPLVPLAWDSDLKYIEVLRYAETELEPVFAFQLRAETEFRTSAQMTGVYMVLLPDGPQADTDPFVQYVFHDTRNVEMPDPRDARWVGDAPLDLPDFADPDEPPRILSVGAASTRFPTFHDVINVTTRYYDEHATGADVPDDNPMALIMAHQRRFYGVRLEIATTGDDDDSACAGIVAAREPRVAKRFETWHRDADLAEGKTRDKLMALRNKFIEDGLRRHLRGQDPAIDEVTIVEAARATERAVEPKDIVVWLDESGDDASIWFDDGEMHVQSFSVGDRITLYDAHTRRFCVNGILTEHFATFEAGREGLVFRENGHSQKFVGHLKQFSKMRYRDGGETDVWDLPEPLGSWLREVGAPQEVKNMVPLTTAVTRQLDLAFGQGLDWKSFERDPSGYAVARMLFPDILPVDAGATAVQHGSGLLVRALCAIGCRNAVVPPATLSENVHAIALLWKFRSDPARLQVMQLLVSSGERLTLSAEHSLPDLVDRLLVVRTQMRTLQEKGLFDPETLNPDHALLLGERPDSTIKVTDIESALSQLEEDAEFFGLVGATNGPAKALGRVSSAELDNMRHTFAEYRKTLESGGWASLRKDEADRYLRAYELGKNDPRRLRYLIEDMQSRYPDVFKPRVDKDIAVLRDEILDMIDEQVPVDLESYLERGQHNLDWPTETRANMRDYLESKPGYRKADWPTRQNLMSLLEFAEAQNMYAKCEAVLHRTRNKGRPVPTDLKRRLAVWPRGFSETFDAFNQFENDLVDQEPAA